MGKDLQTGLLQFHPHADRQRAPDNPRHEGKDEVHRADVLVIGGIEIATPSDRMIAGVVRLLRDAGSYHGPSLSHWDVAPLSDAEKPAQRLSATFNDPTAPALAAQVPPPNQRVSAVVALALGLLLSRRVAASAIASARALAKQL